MVNVMYDMVDYLWIIVINDIILGNLFVSMVNVMYDMVDCLWLIVIND